MVKRLLNAGLQIDIGKCEFKAVKTKYLGIMVTLEGIEMDLAKVQAILEWEAPTSLQEFQRFLEFANFYRHFIKGFSIMTKLFHDLLKKGQHWKWQDNHEKSFRAFQKAFAIAPVLATYDYDRKTVLETDASDWASGEVLSQLND
jgi:hypothetical protein